MGGGRKEGEGQDGNLTHHDRRSRGKDETKKALPGVDVDVENRGVSLAILRAGFCISKAEDGGERTVRVVAASRSHHLIFLPWRREQGKFCAGGQTISVHTLIHPIHTLTHPIHRKSATPGSKQGGVGRRVLAC